MADPLSGLTNMIPSAYDLASGAMSAVWVVVIIIALVGFAFLAIRGKWFIKFPIRTDIFQVRSGVLQAVDVDMARRFVDKKTGEEWGELKKRNVKFKMPTFEATPAMGREEYLARSSQVRSATQMKSKLYLKEITPDKFELVDPRDFVKSSVGEYTRMQEESTDRHWMGLQHEKSTIKYTNSDKWQKLRDALPTIITALAVAVILIFATDSYVKMVQAAAGGAAAVSDAVRQSTQMMNMTMQYMEYMGFHPNATNGTVIIR
jgi:hypothetical protein